MSKVSLTVKQIMNLGLWDKVCDYKGWNPYCYNEGQIDSNEIVEFDDEFKKECDKYEKPFIEELNEYIYQVDVNEYGAKTVIVGIMLAKDGTLAEESLRKEYSEYKIENIVVEEIIKEKLYNKATMIKEMTNTYTGM